MKKISSKPASGTFFKNPFFVLASILGRMKVPPPEMSSEGIELEERIPVTVGKPQKRVISTTPVGHRKSFDRK